MKSINKNVLITGGAGFLGGYLVEYLLKKGEYEIVVFDKLEYHEPKRYESNVRYVKGNILSPREIQRVFRAYGPFSFVFHLASAMPNKAVSDAVMWQTNVLGTKYLAQEAVKNGVKSFIFTSSNVTYGVPEVLPVTEETPPRPLEMYGKSKLEAERELKKYKNRMNIQIFRCPVITGEGRLGLQSILYEFIAENRNVYVLGTGLNTYQFVDATDVCEALEKATRMKGYDIYTIGGDGVMALRRLYEGVISSVGSSSRIVSLPWQPAILILNILDKLNLSPLGVYQYTMMGRSIYADTKKIKKKLGWKPKKTNLQSFIENYKWFVKNRSEFKPVGKSSVSPNRSLTKMGALKLLKIFS